MKKKALPPAAVIHQSRQKLRLLIDRYMAVSIALGFEVGAHPDLSPASIKQRRQLMTQAQGIERLLERQVSIYTHTVRRTK